MKYCKQTTQEHEINRRTKNSLEFINCVIEKDYKKDQSFSIFDENIIVIDLDKAEKIVAIQERRTNDSSMDFCIGLLNQDKKNMLLIELKLNLKDEDTGEEYDEKFLLSLKKLPDIVDKLKKKIDCSKKLLGNSIPVIDKAVFIFGSQINELVKNQFYRLYIGLNYKIITIQELKERYF